MKLGTKIAIFFAVCVAGVLVYLLLRKPKSKDPPSVDKFDPLTNEQFKNNYCRAINNPSYKDHKWVPGKCGTTDPNSKELRCGRDTFGNKYTTLCNAYGSKNLDETDATKVANVGSCCALNERASKISMDNYCKAHNVNAEAYWAPPTGKPGVEPTCKSSSYKKMDAYNKNGICCVAIGE